MTPLLDRAILQSMEGGEVNPFPIQLLVNYWEIHPSQMGACLDDLRRRGVTQISSFIPWQAVESDISHSFSRFLLAASDRRMRVNLIVTPEVGVHYPYSGLPKDIVSRPDNAAMHSDQGKVPASIPPNSFSIPSLFAPELNKRFYSFLSRIDTLLGDFKRTHGRTLDQVTLLLSGSFWKYYRSPRMASQDLFGGVAGDRSAMASLEYRKAVDYYYSQPEFSDPNPAAANRWKTRPMEDINQRWFQQQSEAVFRSRTFQMMRRRSTASEAMEIEIFTPEADPSMAYAHFLQMVSGCAGDFTRLATMVDWVASFGSMGSRTKAPAFIHWSALGGFRGLSDSEKQFLILKALLVLGGMGGGVFVDHQEWFSLSANFRVRTEAFARSIVHGDLKVRTRAVYLTPHLWSSPGRAWKELSSRLGAEARVVASLDWLSQDREASLAVVDPNFILTREAVQRLAAWARSGRIVIIPMSPLFTGMARSELELIVARCPRIDVDHGVRHRIYGLGEGRIVLHDIPGGISNETEEASAWNTFIGAMLHLGDIQGYCRLSDGRLGSLPMMMRGGHTMGLFILNPSRRQVAADIVFPASVEVSDLADSVSGGRAKAKPGRDESVAASRYTMEVPPCGVLPLSVEGGCSADQEERLAAAMLAEETRAGAERAAFTELPGYSAELQMGESLWS